MCNLHVQVHGVAVRVQYARTFPMKKYASHTLYADPHPSVKSELYFWLKVFRVVAKVFCVAKWLLR